MFIESSSFVIGTTAGSLTVGMGTAALELLMLTTPVGWVGLIVAGVSAGISIASNRYVKEKVGFKYDQLMRLLK